MTVRYRRSTSLDDPKPSGKAKVIDVREELWTRVELHLEQIEDVCRSSVNQLADIRREASFARKDRRKPLWGSMGAIQDNVGRHVDAVAGVVYGYMEAIALLDEILNEPTINIRRKTKANGQDQGQEGKEAGGRAQGPSSVKAKGKRQKPSPEHERKARRATKRVEEILAEHRSAKAPAPKRSTRGKPAKRTARRKAASS